MAYRLRYTFNVDWIGPGLPPSTYAGAGSAGNSQTLGLVNVAGGQNSPGLGTAGVINGTDITNMTNAAAADMAAQLNLAANLATMQGWTTGNP